MKHIGLFEGVGGFSLAAEMMGWETIAWCEINPFGQQVLNYHFPKATGHDDIKKTDFTIYRGKCDIVTGGFPCQPYSAAGKRLGTEDDRHLWPEMLRTIREIQPPWVVGENVRGLTNWNGGLVFDQVQADLENEGYQVTPFLLPACAVNAPHRRDRIWFIAYSSSYGQQQRGSGENRSEENQSERIIRERERIWGDNRRACQQGFAANSDNSGTGNTMRNDGNGQTENQRWEGQSQSKSGQISSVTPDTTNTGIEGMRPERENEIHGSGNATDTNKIRFSDKEQIGELGRLRPGFGDFRNTWEGFPTESPVRGKYDGLSRGLVRYIKPEIYDTISKKYSDENLQEVREIFQSKEIREKIGRLYKIHEPRILLQILQLCSPTYQYKERLSAFSEEASKDLLRKLQKYGSFTNTPQGRELEKQFTREFSDSLPFLSHEIALVAMEAERRTVSFMEKHRQESIKAYGNAVVPQVVVQIFKAIGKYNNLSE